MELTRAVGENIKRIRKGKKLSMERLAAEAGVSRSMLGQIERGEANPSVAILGKLASALKVPAEVLLENDDFEPLLELRELDNKPARLDGGTALLRPSLPYDDVLRQETFFLDLYISARYAPEPMVPGCVCLATVLSGTVLLHAEDQDFQLLERDALRFAADRPFRFENQIIPLAAGLFGSFIGLFSWFFPDTSLFRWIFVWGHYSLLHFTGYTWDEATRVMTFYDADPSRAALGMVLALLVFGYLVCRQVFIRKEV